MPKISVIVPVYNSGKVIGKCIESILNQSYKDFELILINDGSKDNSLEEINSYKKIDDRIVVIDNENKGVSETRNIGVEIATGEYIQFIDSDDFIESNMLEDTITKLEKEKADLIITGLYLDIEAKDGVNSSIQSFNYNVSLGAKEIATNIIPRLDGTYINSPVNKLFKRSIIKDNNIIMDNNIDLGEDLIFNLQYLKYCNKVIFDDNAYYHYLMKVEDNLTFKYREDKLELMYYLYVKCKEYLSYCKVEETEIKQLNNLFIKWIYSAFNDLHHSECKLSFKEKLRYIKKATSKYKSIIENTENKGYMLIILRNMLRIPLCAMLASQSIYFIKLKFRQLFYKR